MPVYPEHKAGFQGGPALNVFTVYPSASHVQPVLQ